MERKWSRGFVALGLALLLALVPAAVGAGVGVDSAPAAEPDGWHRFFSYVLCAASVYVALESAGAGILIAAAVCGHAATDVSN